MKILIVSNYFFPQNTPRAFRTTELAIELAKRGNHVSVLFPRQEFDYSDFFNKNPLIELCPTDAITWSKTNTGSASIFNRIKVRLASLFLEYPNIEWLLKMPKILSNHEGYDLLVSIAVPHPIHWGISRCFRKDMNISKRWVADCGDPYMGCKTDSFKKIFYFKYIEKGWCRRCDYISIPVESGIDAYYPEFKSKIKVIPQGFNFENVNICQYKKNAVVTFAFAGSFIKGIRDPRPIMDFLESRHILYKFICYTNQPEFFQGFNSLLDEKIELRSYIARENLIYELSKMDFLLNIENGTSVQSPSKLIDYALTKRPILSVNSQKIDENMFGDFLIGDYSKAFNLSGLEKYNIRNVANQFLSLV